MELKVPTANLQTWASVKLTFCPLWPKAPAVLPLGPLSRAPRDKVWTRPKLRELSGQGAAHEECSRMVLESTLFAAGIVLVACAILVGLYLLCRHTRQSRDKKPSKKLVMPDLQ